MIDILRDSPSRDSHISMKKDSINSLLHQTETLEYSLRSQVADEIMTPPIMSAKNARRPPY